MFISETEQLSSLSFNDDSSPSLARQGIYAIHCDRTDRYYVGSAKNMRTRFLGHRSSLNNGHFNYKLRKDYEKFGPSAFRYIPIEYFDGDTDKLIEIERDWIKTLSSEIGGYNIEENPCRPNSVPFSDEKKIALSKAMIEANKTNGRGVPFRLIDPNGKLHVGTNIGGYGRRLGFDKKWSNAMSDLMRGTSSIRYGWTVENAKPRKKRIRKNLILTDQSGNDFTFNSLVEASGKTGCTASAIGCLLRGETKESNGWTCRKENVAKSTTRKGGNAKPFCIKSPTGEIVSGINIAKYCFDKGISLGGMRMVLQGIKKSHVGWSKI